LSLEQIKYWIRYYRALLIRRDEERFSRVEEHAQTISVPINTTNVSWSSGAQTFPENASSAPADTAISDNPLPTIVRLKDRPAVMQVLIEGTRQQIPYVDSRRSVWNQYDKYTSASRRCWIHKGFLYVSNWDLTGVATPVVELTAIFEDPEQAYNFNLGANSPWDDNLNEFPLSADLLQQVTQSIMSGELQVMASAPSDHSLDNLPDRQAE